MRSAPASPISPPARQTTHAPSSFNFEGARCVFVGIGGCGMSGLAREFVARGAEVSGVDAVLSDVTAALTAEGMNVGGDDASATLPEACDVVVMSAAVSAEHPLVQHARARRIRTMTYAQALGLCMEGRTGVAIAGAHGKSTTSAMLAIALTEAGLDPSVIVGATVPQMSARGGAAAGHRIGAPAIPTGARAGSPGVFIAEACEFNRSFHNLHPTLASIGVVEADHLDIYGSLDAVVEAYAQFARQIAPASEGGKLIIGHDGAHRREVTADVVCDVETIGFSPDADWRIEVAGHREVALSFQGQLQARWTCPLPGEHNALNSAVAMALGLTLGADAEKLGAALSTFRGVHRRTEFLGERTLRSDGAIRVYDDYGHHPTEVDATLRALRAHEDLHSTGGRLICVFQPHQHSRTRFLLSEFAQSFSQADLVIVPHIYFVRDSEIEKTLISAADLVDRLRERGVAAMHVYPFDAIVEQLEHVCRAGDVLVVMGAGPVWKVARGFMSRAQEAVS